MDFTKLDRYLDRLTDRGIPFGDLIVTKDGETVYRRLVGHSDAERTKLLDGSEIYWLFSVSKVVTCAMAMKLVEEGKIALDELHRHSTGNYLRDRKEPIDFTSVKKLGTLGI